MKLIYNLILIVLMTFVFGQTNCAFSQTQNEIKPEKDVDAKIIPVKNFREKIKLNFPQKENQQTNKEKKEKRLEEPWYGCFSGRRSCFYNS